MVCKAAEFHKSEILRSHSPKVNVTCVEKALPFQFIIPLPAGGPLQGCTPNERSSFMGHHAPPPCESRLAVECKRNMMNYVLAHFSFCHRAGLRKP